MALVAAALFRKAVTDNVDDGPVAAPQETLFPSNSTERIERLAPPDIVMFPWSIDAGPTSENVLAVVTETSFVYGPGSMRIHECAGSMLPIAVVSEHGDWSEQPNAPPPVGDA
jgi:hypothetical protein